MFDTAKVQQMTVELEKFAREHEDIYVIPEFLTPEAFALFRRMRITIRAALLNTPTPFARKEIFDVPVLTTVEASPNFNERTAFIVLKQKSVPFMRTTVSFNLRGGVFIFPVFVMANDEVSAVYDRLTIFKVLQQYQEDGLPTPAPKNFATRFARGLTTFLDYRFQNVKFQLWDNREFLKPQYDFDDTAIVIQGPLVYDNNYTAETFKLYRSIYSNVPIVVSTWKGEATEVFRRVCKENSVVLLENEPPKIPGPWNVNMQIESSHQGVKYVQENTSAKFVLKTRTDQRVNRMDFLVYFKNLLETFPPNGEKLQQRIILFESQSRMSFFFNDQFVFGHLLDMSRLYGLSLYHDPGEMTYAFKNTNRLGKVQEHLLGNANCPFDYHCVHRQNRKLYNHNKMLRRFCNPEIYITRTFYKKYIAPLDETKLLETSWKFTADYLILIDPEAILFDWSKYEDKRYETIFNHKYQTNFSRWLDMYRNFKIDWV